MNEFCFACQQGTMSADKWWFQYMVASTEQRTACLKCDKRHV